MPIKLVLADDHPIVLAGLENLFRRQRDCKVVSLCSDGVAAMEAVRRFRPDVLVLDLKMPRLDGLGVLRQIYSEQLWTRCVLLAVTLDDLELTEAMALGVKGAMLKEMAPQVIVDCVRAVHAGARWFDAAAEELYERQRSAARRLPALLTPRELEVARAIATGARNKDIAEKLAITEGTVKLHLHAIYNKLGLDGRMALLLHLRQAQFV